MASTTGVGDEETAPLLATSPTSSTGVINSQYQSLSQISSSNDSDVSNTSNTDPGWTLSQSARRLYISHTLSTWNSRVFEFGMRGASAITLSSWVGSYIDRKDRLNTVRLSIVVSQRLVVAASCVIFFILSRVESPSDELRVGLLAALIFMACVEKLAAIMNLVSVERDWVIVVARSDTTALRSILDGVSTETAILVNLAMNCTSVIVEYFTIAKVYYQVPELQHPKTTPPIVPQNEEQQTRQNAWVSFKKVIQKTSGDLRLYFTHPAFAPSFSIALLYCTVLSFGGVMVTYLLASGYTSAQIAAMRTVSVTLEVLATWIGPWVMRKIGPVRAGLWFLSWELGCLAIGVSIFWRYADNVLVSTLGLVCGSMLSRIGLWGVDLSAQVIIQEEVETEKRGAFSAVEASWQNVFEMCSYTSTIIFSSPSQFHNPTALSVTSVFFAWLLYSSFVKKRRGHLVHWPTCMSPEKQQATIDELFESGPSRRREGL
ncbi:Solute carrier family 40 member 1 [Fusarium oxysporum f. sp. cubense race 1]|uniref:Solute carrier family 40 member n=1 Tax=Fusarium oxysporum f. sp. cubense (strain race 1) TaxID=1229664 RepID=N4U3K5_FUSC1|nr:Solute carrier family 40 member 1 [Fusarium oxysporum f. sp. cubense race 1]